VLRIRLRDSTRLVLGRDCMTTLTARLNRNGMARSSATGRTASDTHKR